MRNKTHYIILVLAGLFSGQTLMAQENKTVTVSGIIFCEDSIMGTLQDVAIYNESRHTGTISNQKGEFSIKMGQNDTLIFSTVQHTDEVFYFKENEPFQNTVISVPMKMDMIWMDLVSVMGKGDFEAFKRELLALELPDNEPSLLLPVVNKYALEYETGEGAIKIRGPLTYLSNKIRKLKRRTVKEPKE